MAKSANSTPVPEFNRRDVFKTGAALLLASGSAATATAAPNALDDAELFAAINAWEQGRPVLAELGVMLDKANDELKASKANLPPELLEPLNMPFGPMRPRSNPQEPGWTNEVLWQYIDRGVLPGPMVVRGDDGLLYHYDEGPIAPATIERAKELHAIRQAYSEAVAAAQTMYDDAWKRFDRMATLQFERLLAVATTPARSAEGARAKCAVLLAEPMFADDLANTDDGAIMRGLIADLQALAA